MPRKMVALASALFLLTAVASADDKDKTKPAKAKVEGVQLNINRKLDEKQFGYSFEQTNVGLLVQLTGKQLLGVDASSKIATFDDDKGTSLLSKDTFFKTNFSTFPRISTDRASMIVSISSNKAPTRGATKITTKGDLVAIIGTEEKTTEEVAIKFEKGAKAKIGDMNVEVTSDKGFGTDGASFSIKTTGSTIKAVTIKDGDGKAVEATSFGRFGFGKEWTHSFTLKKVVKEGKLTVTYFSKEEKLTVPIDIGVTLGP